MRGEGPRKIGDLVRPFLKRKGLEARIDLAGAVDRWSSLVGPQVRSVTRAEGVTADGVLWVRTITSAWAAELSLMAPRILAQLNDGRGGRIREIRWIVGPLPRDDEPAP